MVFVPNMFLYLLFIPWGILKLSCSQYLLSSHIFFTLQSWTAASIAFHPEISTAHRSPVVRIKTLGSAHTFDLLSIPPFLKRVWWEFIRFLRMKPSFPPKILWFWKITSIGNALMIFLHIDKCKKHLYSRWLWHLESGGVATPLWYVCKIKSISSLQLTPNTITAMFSHWTMRFTKCMSVVISSIMISHHNCTSDPATLR